MAPPTLPTLPPEILFNILSYTSPFSVALLPKHPLLNTAATTKHLCGVVEEYCRVLLRRHAHIDPPKAPRTGAFVCRRKWFKWLRETCQVCGRGSRRRAILDAGMTCCKKCDNDMFPKMVGFIRTHARTHTHTHTHILHEHVTLRGIDKIFSCLFFLSFFISLSLSHANQKKKTHTYNLCKQTQTQAIAQHGLSKLDLFTPNALHPNLPPLRLGAYTLMGGETIMLAEASVLDRKAHIRSLLGAGRGRDDPDANYLRRRAAAHERIIQHMDLAYVVVQCSGHWVKAYRFVPGGPFSIKVKSKSMETEDGRELYVRKGLEREWAAMGMLEGKTAETAVVVED